jgi:hypothetical protein
MKKNIEASLVEKEKIVEDIKNYEEKRSILFSQSLHIATQATLNTLSILKDAHNKSKKMKQVLSKKILLFIKL